MPFPAFSAGSVFLSSIVFRDAKGNTARNHYYFSVGTAPDLATAQGDAEALVTAWAALSNAALQSVTGLGSRYGVAQYGAHTVGGAYESVTDKAMLIMQDAQGGLHRFEVPAPKIAIFKSDKITVDPGNALVSTLVGLIIAGAAGAQPVTRSGNSFTNFMGGFHKARKLRKRLNTLVLTPDLTPALPAE